MTFNCKDYAPYYWHFNSHAHVERDKGYRVEVTATFNFNSHAHVERDKLISGAVQTASISTHTLTWSVTSADSIVPDSGEDFNSHAHVERDRTGGIWTIPQYYFNSHAHVERDQGGLNYGNDI